MERLRSLVKEFTTGSVREKKDIEVVGGVFSFLSAPESLSRRARIIWEKRGYCPNPEDAFKSLIEFPFTLEEKHVFSLYVSQKVIQGDGKYFEKLEEGDLNKMAYHEIANFTSKKVKEAERHFFHNESIRNANPQDTLNAILRELKDSSSDFIKDISRKTTKEVTIERKKDLICLNLSRHLHNIAMIKNPDPSLIKPQKVLT